MFFVCLFCGDESVLKLVVVMIVNSVNNLEVGELWYVNMNMP